MFQTLFAHMKATAQTLLTGKYTVPSGGEKISKEDHEADQATLNYLTMGVFGKDKMHEAVQENNAAGFAIAAIIIFAVLLLGRGR